MRVLGILALVGTVLSGLLWLGSWAWMTFEYGMGFTLPRIIETLSMLGLFLVLSLLSLGLILAPKPPPPPGRY
jgi:hypothetical protein